MWFIYVYELITDYWMIGGNGYKVQDRQTNGCIITIQDANYNYLL